jgi:hypothetical protein
VAPHLIAESVFSFRRTIMLGLVAALFIAGPAPAHAGQIVLKVEWLSYDSLGISLGRPIARGSYSAFSAVGTPDLFMPVESLVSQVLKTTPGGFDITGNFNTVSLDDWGVDLISDTITARINGAAVSSVIGTLGFSNEGTAALFYSSALAGAFNDAFSTDINAGDLLGVSSLAFVIPEPGTAALLGLGLAGLGVAGRKRREASQGTA